MALARSASSRSKTGSPQPGGQPRTAQVTTPPSELPSFRAASTAAIIRSATARSGQRIGVASTCRARHALDVALGGDAADLRHPGDDLDAPARARAACARWRRRRRGRRSRARWCARRRASRGCRTSRRRCSRRGSAGTSPASRGSRRAACPRSGSRALMGVPSVRPSKTPLRIRTVSDSLRWRGEEALPRARGGRGRAGCPPRTSGRRGGQPSTTAPIAAPCDSPHVVTRKSWPKVLPIAARPRRYASTFSSSIRLRAVMLNRPS